MVRKIITIDEEKCTGCGLCVPDCPEGALQIIDNKARLVGDLFCDGLGACIGTCPEGAIEVIEREAEPYDEHKVMANIVTKGENTIRAHLEHLKSHGADDLHAQALEYLATQGYDNTEYDDTVEQETQADASPCPPSGCPGSRSFVIGDASKQSGAPAAGLAANDEGRRGQAAVVTAAPQGSALRHWPVQLHLANPRAPQYQGADLLMAADCTAFSVGDFHDRFLTGKALCIACPKLDDGMDSYLQKLTAMIDDAGINTMTVLTMEVPCCGGLVRLAQASAEQAKRKVPIKWIVVSVEGKVIREEWL